MYLTHPKKQSPQGVLIWVRVVGPTFFFQSGSGCGDPFPSRASAPPSVQPPGDQGAWRRIRRRRSPSALRSPSPALPPSELLPAPRRGPPPSSSPARPPSERLLGAAPLRPVPGASSPAKRPPTSANACPGPPLSPSSTMDGDGFDGDGFDGNGNDWASQDSFAGANAWSQQPSASRKRSS